MTSKITREQLERGAIVYVRQSTAAQVQENRESQRRQYGLRDSATALGFRRVEVIDDDLGRSGSGKDHRPGFDRLVGAVCANEVGAIFCIEASRLARNGRDWHLLLELCAMVGTLVIDPDGIYDSRLTNDRLLLGIKGTMSEFELHLLRQRSREALLAKAHRGALEVALPVGFSWVDGRIEKDPDRRVREAIELVLQKFRELRSMRQVLLWLLDEELLLPVRDPRRSGDAIEWHRPVYHRVRSILTSPLYAGAYAYGRTESRTQIIEGRPRKSEGHKKPREQWTVLLRDHHAGYLDWEEYESNQRLIAENAHVKKDGDRKAGRGGRALLTGMLRCGRCGRLLRVRYSGADGTQHRYLCAGDEMRAANSGCLSVGGVRTDRAIGAELLAAAEPHAIEAAVEAHRRRQEDRERIHQAKALELEQAHYEARLAGRRFERVDPDNRLVAAELEARWNAALQRVHALERGLVRQVEQAGEAAPLDPEKLRSLARDLPALWNAEDTEPSLRQRIAAVLLHEVILTVDEVAQENVLTLHWKGGRHSETRVRRRSQRRKKQTDLDADEIVRRMSGAWPDKEIAATLNRLHLKTATGQHWTQVRVRALRHRRGLLGYDPSKKDATCVPLSVAAERLGVSHVLVKRLIDLEILPARQVVLYAPWEIRVTDLDSQRVREAATRLQNRQTHPPHADEGSLPLPGLSR